MKRERKPFHELGWISSFALVETFSDPCAGTSDNRVLYVMEENRDFGSAQAIHVEVREVVPPCRHPAHDRTSLSTETGEMLEVCRNCGAHRATAYGNNEWRKPRRQA